ncbi:MAG: general secretion pathway protein GspM [Opitutaceae bacterium]|nr:general secretion pathway protein GspM [Opitutaceae bacterium]
MKLFFLGRALREKVLLLAFAALALLIWGGRGLARAQAFLAEARAARAELATQRVWLDHGPEIDAKAVAATKNLDPARTLNATRLVGELNELAAQAGLSADISGQRTERTSQFAFHTVQANFRRTELGPLLKFYEALSQRSPYIGLEQFTLAADRANPGQINASFRIVSAELGP